MSKARCVVLVCRGVFASTIVHMPAHFGLHPMNSSSVGLNVSTTPIQENTNCNTLQIHLGLRNDHHNNMFSVGERHPTTYEYDSNIARILFHSSYQRFLLLVAPNSKVPLRSCLAARPRRVRIWAVRLSSCSALTIATSAGRNHQM
jgi:hypothetical protein